MVEEKKGGATHACGTGASLHRQHGEKMMIRDYCGRNGTTIPEQGALFDEGVRTPPRRS
jgi:hypothetical protein